ncbi:MAG: hypothetical protein AAF488_06930, partial [Planctomycetota bacterium]
LAETKRDGADLDFSAQVAFLAGDFRLAAECAAQVDTPSFELRLLAAEAIAVRGGQIGSIDEWLEVRSVPGGARARAWDLAITATERRSMAEASELAAHLLIEAEGPTVAIPGGWAAYLFARGAELRGEALLAVAGYRAAAYGFGRSRHPRNQVRALVRQAGVLSAIGRGPEARSALRRAAELLPRVGGVVEREWIRRSPAVGLAVEIVGNPVQELAQSIR